MESFIIDNILTKKNFDIIDCIQIQDVQNKAVFDVLFKETVGKLASMKKQASIIEWATSHILNHFEVLDRIYVWKYWIGIEMKRLNHMVEHQILLKAQKRALEQ
ncbi:uncharacterized protein EV154DRAFT_485892 [Mucor mucedo]|uniref:uncharacterized protein n=1 Tax=Mucor mucedo TaxID=29922 RepID=UPI002220CA5A|nr:uncharacterized protein EV154DRAFT_485892 [Mucor mucedo]KAI7880469.1 hypothetical protein EV154DRAFT_485892 [Mucor mucedo]